MIAGTPREMLRERLAAVLLFTEFEERITDRVRNGPPLPEGDLMRVWREEAVRMAAEERRPELVTILCHFLLRVARRSQELPEGKRGTPRLPEVWIEESFRTTAELAGCTLAEMMEIHAECFPRH